MAHPTSIRPWAALLLVGLAACTGHPAEQEMLDVSQIVIAMPASLGASERPPVVFDHAKHTKALKKQGCDECHTADRDKALAFDFRRAADPVDRDGFMELYHEECGGCHQKHPEKDTPVACADCHVAGATSESMRTEIRFDYSLHARHSQAFAEDPKCGTCHHVYDEQQDELSYREGEESACRDCHGSEDDGDNPSLEHASHSSCINCHLERLAAGEEAGPQECAGCHDARQRAKIERLAEIPRIDRNQPATVWIGGADGESALVAFDHQGHEPQGESCSTCHHDTLKACDDCHTVAGRAEGGGVTLREAYHDRTSRHGCVGCHQAQAATDDCAGCHRRIADTPRDRTCAICHGGPDRQDPARNTPPIAVEPARLEPLPAVSERDFPETVTIDALAHEYAASTMPHKKIVERLQAIVQASPLARRFHMTTELLCTGCHHESPAGERPPPCSSCHDEVGARTEDVPGLRAAFHRLCLGCHEEMGIDERGCTDCHDRARQEVAR